MVDLQLAVALAKGSSTERGRALDLLVDKVLEDSGCIDAWIWLADVVDAKEEKRYCLQMVREIDDQNVPALRGLVQLGKGPARRPRVIVDRLALPLPGFVDTPVVPSVAFSSVSVDELVARGLLLPPQERVRLINLLVKSLV